MGVPSVRSEDKVYDVLSSNDLEYLIDCVNYKMGEGWYPSGSFNVFLSENIDKKTDKRMVLYSQAMIKK